jgi:hypothetical protein
MKVSSLPVGPRLCYGFSRKTKFARVAACLGTSATASIKETPAECERPWWLRLCGPGELAALMHGKELLAA